MAACQDDIVLTRIDGNGNWQTSSDGGTTWVDTPGQDPRLATPIAAPASGADGDSKRCAAANSITTYFKRLMESIAVAKDNSANLSDLTAIVIGVLLLLGLISGGWLFAFLGGLIGLVYANYDATTWRAAFTDEVWQAFICAIYPFINADASVTDYLGMADAVNTSLPDGIARENLVTYLRLVADHGLTNAGRAMYGGALSCVCGCVGENYEISPGAETWGEIIEAGSDYLIINLLFCPNTVGAYFARLRVASGDACNITSVETLSGSGWISSAFTIQGETADTFGHNPIYPGVGTTLATSDGIQSFQFVNYTASQLKVHLG